MSKEFIKEMQKRIFNQRRELERLNNLVSEIEQKCNEWEQTLEEFKNAIKGIIWFDIALTNEETQYLIQRIEEEYEEFK
jgi:wobble nucleotide-excising tRNase